MKSNQMKSTQVAPVTRTAFTLKEVAQRVGLSESAIRRAVRAGELKAAIVSRGKRPVWRVTAASEAAWLASLENVPAAE